MSWVDPDDVELPETLDVFEKGFLYARGKELRIFSHQPPQPFGERGLPPNTRVVDQNILNTRSPRNHVFTKLPKERDLGSRLPDGASSYFAEEDSATLVITSGLAIGDETGPQILLCKFATQDRNILKPTIYWDKMGLKDRPTQVVAKVYDPLMYFKVDQLAPWDRNDVVDHADSEYAAEAAAYAEFHEAMRTNPIIRDFVPAFYGTWTTTIKNEGWGCSDTRPSDDAANGILHERQVRIVLMEYIEGGSIWDICDRRWKNAIALLVPPKIDTDQDKDLARRLNILARILRGLVAMDHIGVLPLRFRATNFIVVDAESKSDKSLQRLGKHRVVMVSHGCADITRYTTDGPCYDQHFPRPRHPAYSHYNPDELYCLKGWYPKEWQEESDHKTFFEWAHKVFRPEDFTGEDEIKKITARLVAKRVTPEPKQLEPPRPSDVRGAPSVQNIRDHPNLSDQESASAADTDSVFDNNDNGLASSKDTLPPQESGSSQLIQSAGLSGVWTADEPTAKEAGKKAEASGITTVAEEEEEEAEGDELDDGHLADTEVSPKSSSSEKSGMERERERK